MNHFNHIHFIINPASGRDEPILNVINRALAQYDTHWDISITHTFGDGKRLAEEAIEKGADLIVAYGGDGTLIDVVNGMVGSDIPFAVLPGGTGNGIAKEFGIPLNLKEAVESLFTYPIVPIDVGYADGSYYLLRLDIGIIADVVSGTNPEMKNRWGAMAYLMNTATHITRPKQTYQLEIGDDNISIEGIGCIVTNGNKIGALHFGLNDYVKIDDGLLDIIVMTDVGTILQNVASTVIQLSDNVAVNLHHWQAKSVKITLDEPANILADGEAIGKTPIYTEVKHHALHVVKSSSKN